MGASSTPAWRLHRTIPSDTEVGSRLIDDLSMQMREHGWDERQIFQVQLAYEEAIVNAIRHGNRYSPEKTVEVVFICNSQQVRIEITDQGCGFDPGAVPDPTSDERLENPGGRGVLMIRECMSDVSYGKGGCQLTMVKDRSDLSIGHDDDQDDE
jgi:serine/threonine-protein kinase RsbW